MFRSPHFWGERFRGTVKAREFCCAAFSATYLGQLRGDTQMTLDSDEYGRRTLRFIEKLQSLKNYEEMQNLIVEELNWYGLTHVSCFSIPGPGEGADRKVLLTQDQRATSKTTLPSNISIKILS